MNKISTLSFLFSSLTVISCSNENQKHQDHDIEINSNKPLEIKALSDKQALGLKGDVEMLKQEEFNATNPGEQIGNKTGENSFLIKLNENGEKIEENFLDNEGLKKEISTFNYNDKGIKIGKVIKNVNGETTSIYSYEYDGFGRMIKYHGNELKDKMEYYFEYKYDNYGNELSSTMYAPDGNKIQSSEYDYKNGLKAKIVLKDNSEVPYAICEYSNNESGDVIKEKYYTGNNILFEEYHYDYIYDKHNNWIMKKYFLDKKNINSVSNENKKEGIQTITMRTLTYR